MAQGLQQAAINVSFGATVSSKLSLGKVYLQAHPCGSGKIQFLVGCWPEAAPQFLATIELFSQDGGLLPRQGSKKEQDGVCARWTPPSLCNLISEMISITFPLVIRSESLGPVLPRWERLEEGVNTTRLLEAAPLQEARDAGLKSWLWHTLVYDLGQRILPLEASGSSFVKWRGSWLLPWRAMVGVLMTKHTREALNHPWHRVNPQKMGLGDIAGGMRPLLQSQRSTPCYFHGDLQPYDLEGLWQALGCLCDHGHQQGWCWSSLGHPSRTQRHRCSRRIRQDFPPNLFRPLPYGDRGFYPRSILPSGLVRPSWLDTFVCLSWAHWYRLTIFPGPQMTWQRS